MNVQVEIPDEVFNSSSQDISREVLEAVAIVGFRTGQLTTYQIKRLLGFDSREEVHQFLARHDVPWVDYPVEEVNRERKLLKELLP